MSRGRVDGRQAPGAGRPAADPGRSPGNGRRSPAGSVVVRHDDAAAGRSTPLRTEDLNWRELRDALWLATLLGPELLPPPEREQRPPLTAPPPPSPAAAPPGTAPAGQPPLTAQDWAAAACGTLADVAFRPDPAALRAPLAWPAVPGLPDAKLIARALRPFGRGMPLPWRQELDEDATAVRAAQERRWLPVWRPALGRWFDVALVVDSARSLDIWQHTVAEFRELLRRQGAFRDVRTYFVDFSVSAATLAVTTETGDPRNWRELVDPTGRRLVLVLTDMMGAAWSTGAAARLLASWGRSMPTAVVHVLAQRLWHWGGLLPEWVRLTAAAPGVPNRQWHAEIPRRGTAPAERPGPGAVPIPVLGLDPEWMASWARLVASPTAGRVDMTAVFVRSVGPPPADQPTHQDAEPQDTSAQARVRRFRTFASLPAFHLAGLLAAVPLTQSAMWLVQRVLLPESDQSTMAEVVLGGLLHRLPARGGPFDPFAVSFEFYDGVRNELLATSFRADTARVARLVGDYLKKRVPSLQNFREALDNPNGVDYPEIKESELPYLMVQEAVFRALSGDFARRAKGLRRRIDGLRRSAARPAQSSVDGNVPGDHPGTTPIPQKGSDSVSTVDPQVRPTADGGPEIPGGGDVTVSGTRSAGEMKSGPRTTTEVERITSRQPRIWGQVPLRNPNFVGRDELLEQFRQRLSQPGTTAVLPEALHGLGGVGKSQTVAEYIYRHATDYDIVWWVSAEQVTQIRSSFVELADRLGIDSAGGADIAVPAVLEQLRTGESRWLLVFDNAERPEDVREFFPAGLGHIVVTSRNPQWAGVARTVEVDLFTREESRELLRKRGGEILDEEADQLAQALGDLPLAIEQAATWRAQTGMPVADYLRLLEQNRTELLESDGAGGYQSSVAAAWRVPLERLRRDHPAALELLQTCAFFGAEPISRSLFTGARDLPVPEALRAALADPIKLNKAIREISRYSLAKIDHRSNSLQLHRLVQAVLRNQLDEPGQHAIRHAVHLLLAAGDPDDPTTAVNWSRYAELLPHAVASGAMRSPDGWVRRLLVNLARYLTALGDYGGALDLTGKTLQAWEEVLGADHLDTLTMARLHASALRKLDRYVESRELNQRTYERLVATVGDDHENVLDMMDVIAADYRYQGLFARELEIRLDIYDTSAREFGEDDPNTLRLGSNLTGSLRLMGRYQQARELDDSIWQRRTLVLGPDHPATFASLDSLSMDMRECGDYAEACRIEEDTISKARLILGDDGPRVIGARRNLAVAQRRAGDPARALELSRDCFERYRRRHGELHLDTSTALMNMSTDLWHLGRYAEALEFGELSFQQVRKTYGPDHPFTHIAACNLAVCLRLSGDAQAARERNQTTLAAYRTAFDADHPTAIVLAINLASDLAAVGEPEAAHQLDEESLERATRVLGEDHPTALAAMANLSLDLVALGRADDAAIVQAKAVQALRYRLGDDHPATGAAVRGERANCDTDTMQF